MNPCSKQSSCTNTSSALVLSLPLIATPKPDHQRVWRIAFSKIFCYRAILEFRKDIVRVPSKLRPSSVALASSAALRPSSLKHRRSSSAGPQHDEFQQLVDESDSEHYNSKTVLVERREYLSTSLGVKLCRNLSTKSSFHSIDIVEEEPIEQKHPEAGSTVADQDLKSKVDDIIREKDLAGLVAFGGVQRVASVLGSDLRDGLNVDIGGHPFAWNAYVTKLFQFFLEAFNNLNVFFLLISFGLSILIEITEKEPMYMWRDSMVILFAVFVLVTVPTAWKFYHEIKLRREQGNKLEVTVTRRAAPTRISISAIKEGDLLHLEKNDIIPADGLFVNGNGLVLDEVNREVEENNLFMFSGSKVTDGSCSMLVTSVGITILSEVSNTARHETINNNIFEARIERPHAYIERLTLIFSVLVMVVMVIQFFIKKPDVVSLEKPELKGNLEMGMMMKMLVNIALKPSGRSAVVSILTVLILVSQHTMPLVIVMVLHYWQVESGDAELKNLSACCTMGLVTTICIDVTGGLVCKPTEREVKQFWIGKKDVTTSLSTETNIALEGLHRVLAISAQKPEIFGNPQSDKLVSWTKERLGATVSSSDGSLQVLDYKSLGSEEECYGVLVKENEEQGGTLHLHWRGHASTLLRMCSHYYDCAGREKKMENCKTEFEKLIKDMEDNGLHSVALAYRRMDIQELRENDLILLALAGLESSGQDEIRSAVTKLRNSRVGIRLMSEDGPLAANNIAENLGLSRFVSNNSTFEGPENIIVMECSSPEEKTCAIRSLQEEGDIVAFYGGFSTNDIPSLLAADLRIVPNVGATETARRLSDIVIIRNNNIGALIPILESGRRAYHNIQVFFQLQLISCISGCLITLAATTQFGDSLISTIQLILSNFVVYISGGLMMTMKLKRPARSTCQQAKRTEPLLTMSIWMKIIFHVCYQVFILFLIQLEGQEIFNVDKKVTKAMVFNSFFICQIFNHYVSMKLIKRELLDNIIYNYWFLFSVGIVIVLQVLVVLYAGKLNDGISLNGTQQLICLLIAALPWGLYYIFQFSKSSFLSKQDRSAGAPHVP